jgi:DHA1 family bicyclomycin/chloramphenicol resistance-like MFS transporter
MLPVRFPPASMAFTLLLGFVVALPSFGIDMSLPALTAMGGALGVAPERAGS